MPKLKHRVPFYCHHKASGQAIVTLNGKDHYLGPYESPESKIRYNILIAEWLTAGRQLPTEDADNAAALTINEIFLPYWQYAQQHYCKHGRPRA